MRKVFEELRVLSALTRTLPSEIALLRIALRRIIVIGIILNLLPWLIILRLSWQSNDNGLEPKSISPKERRRTDLGQEGMKNTVFEKTLLYILEISCPVGMFVEGPFGIPPSKPLSWSSSLWSFDADQCVSSEGFLVTFTPASVEGSGEVIFSYPFYSKLNSLKIHFFNGRQSIQGRRRRAILNDLISQRVLPVSAKNGSTAEVEVNFFGFRAQGELVRSNVMTPAPKDTEAGILVASNPTDEDRIGTGRNTWRSLYEKSV